MTETTSGVQKLLTSCREQFDRLKMAADWQRIARLTLMVVMSTIYTTLSMLRFVYEMITKGTNVRPFFRFLQNPGFCRLC